MRKTIACFGSIMLLVVFGAVAQDYNNFYDAEERIKAHCEEVFPDSYSLQEECIKQEWQAVEDLKRGAPQ